MEALMIGVSGMRGTIGGTLTPPVIGRMAAAYATWLKRTQTPASGTHFRIVFGRDSRPSGAWVRDAAISALTASGIEVIDLDIVTTPGTAMMTRHLGADGGIIATASHNPIQWNGLKTLNRNGSSLAPEDAIALKQLYDAAEADFVRVEKLIPPARNTQTNALHVKRVLEHVDVLGISTRRYKVVVDSVNGAGGVSAATLLSKLGCQLIHLNDTPNGLFPHEPEPTAANLTALAAEVKRQKAHVGFAQDPDADRLAIVDENGTYIGEEYTLVLAAKLMLSKRPGVAVANLSSSRMLDDVAARHGSTVVRSKVGEANVVQTMLETGAIVGGEGNGGVIDPRIVLCRDSLVGMAYTLQLMAGAGRPLSQIVSDIPRYEMIKSKFDCRREDADKVVEALKAQFAGERIDTQDGIRIDWDNAWVHARASNTEPIFRIMAEAPARPEAEKRVREVQAVVDRVLRGGGTMGMG